MSVKGTTALHNVRAVLFDLDDTLYPEAEYVRSGFRAVSEAFRTLEMSADQLLSLIQHYHRIDRAHVFDLVAASLIAGGYRSRFRGAGELAAQMIACYRNHEPRIRLHADAAKCLAALRTLPVRVGIVTDGIWEVQERKVRALDLHSIVDLIVYTDKLAPERRHWKPSPAGFAVAAEHLGVPVYACCYVGDNPAKDFAGPASLGMVTVWVRRPDGVYGGNRPGYPDPCSAVEPTCELCDLRLLPGLIGLGGPRSGGS